MQAITVGDRDAGVGGPSLMEMAYPHAADNDVIVRVRRGRKDTRGSACCIRPDRRTRGKTIIRVTRHEGRSIMMGVRIAGGILAVGMMVAGTPSSHAADRAAASAPTQASQHRYQTRAPASRRPSPTDTPIYTQPLPHVKGKTFTSVLVYFPPGARAAPHRHGSAFVYAYVLEGTVRSQLAGEPVRTYHQGQDWVEPPGSHHLLTENTSPTKPAKLLVIFISRTGAKLKINDQPK